MIVSLIIKNPHKSNGTDEVSKFYNKYPDIVIPLLGTYGNIASWIDVSKDSIPLPFEMVDEFMYGLMKFEDGFHSYRDMGHYLTTYGCYGKQISQDKQGIYGSECMHFQIRID